MDIREWQRRLESVFELQGAGGDVLKRLETAEQEYGEHIRNKYYGHRALHGGFTIFFEETLRLTSRSFGGFPIAERAPYHPALFLDTLTNFRSFCAAEKLLYGGYPLDGYALLRDLKDEAAFIFALVGGTSDYRRVRGLNQFVNTANLRDQRRQRKAEERKILDLTFGKTSGFSETTLSVIKKWMGLFNLEIHGSQLTNTSEFQGWITGREPLTIAPVPVEQSIAVYLSVVPVIAWMHHRYLPFLQLQKGAFGNAWAEKWVVLDESFRWMLGTLKSPNPELGPALVTLIDAKFASTPETFYLERVLLTDVGS